MPSGPRSLAAELVAGWSERPGTQHLLAAPRQGLYFVACLGHIKIGIAKDVRARLRDLRATVPTDLDALGWVPIGDYAALARCEAALHLQFTETRRPGGEWFRDNPDLRAFIALYARAWPPASR